MSALSHQSRVELARLRASIHINPNSFRHPVVIDSTRDDGRPEWMPDISEPDDVGLQATPEVAVYRGVQTDASRARMVLERDNPFRAVPGGIIRRVVDDNHAATQTRLHMDDAEFEYVTRNEDDATVLRRWFYTDTEAQDETIRLREDGDENVWVERMTHFRRMQLHRLLTEYFGGDYKNQEIVLKWERVQGRWTPVEKMPVLDWIETRVWEKGSQLAGFASCAHTLRAKMARKRVSQTGEAWWKTYNAV